MKQTDIPGFARALGLSPTRSQIDLLLEYEAILGTRGANLGLISRADRSRVRERHLLDCVRAAVPAPAAGVAYDLGSGAGLPGVVVAILRPTLSVTLVERRSRRAGFLEWVVQNMGLANVEIAPCGIDDLPRGQADICFARALAPLPQSWDLAVGLLRPRGKLIYFAGERAEIPDALPGCAEIEVSRCEMLESTGPLAIISR